VRNQLDLGTVLPELHELAKEAFKIGDYGRLLPLCDGQKSRLIFVADNVEVLKNRDIYEPCLLMAYTTPRTNFHDWRSSFIRCLFDAANSEKLRAAGDPVPDQASLRIYRGIAGENCRRPRGWAWTLSLDVACWYAMRYDLNNPTVLTSVIDSSDVRAYSNRRNEFEVICRPKYARVMSTDVAFLKAAAERQCDIIEQSNRRLFRAWKERIASKFN
jgi:hypothetical protein